VLVLNTLQKFFSHIPQKVNLKRKKHYRTSGYSLPTRTANRLKRAEVQEVINSLNPKKSSGYDLIIGKILKELPVIEIKYLTQLFNTVLLD
jgi:hypothetical protein